MDRVGQISLRGVSVHNLKSIDLDIPRGQLVVFCGLSGSGKSHLGRSLAGRIGSAGGARHLRSDVQRKRLAGLPTPEERLPASAYTQESSDRVYAAMREQAASLLADGVSVICDAVFAKPAERREIEALAAETAVPFIGIWLEAPHATLAARIEGRRGDASDATTAVLESQLGYELGVSGLTLNSFQIFNAPKPNEVQPPRPHAGSVLDARV